jgi:hypothetical protein
MNYPKITVVKSAGAENQEAVIRSTLLLHAIPEEINYLVCPRIEGEFTNKGYYLSSKYDWVIGTDSLGAVVLVPLKRL